MSLDKLTREKLYQNMEPELSNIINTWNDDGIIYEGQYRSICQHTIQHYSNLISEIILEKTGSLSSDSNSLAEGIDTKIGFMYYIFDTSRIECAKARELARKFFEQKSKYIN